MTKAPEEQKDEQALGRTVKLIFAHPRTWLALSVLLGGGHVWNLMQPQEKAPAASADSFNESELEKIIRKAVRSEIGKFEAGWKAFVQTRPAHERLQIFEAMARHEEAARRREEREN